MFKTWLFETTYATEVIDANSQSCIYEERMETWEVGFLERFANSWVPNTKYEMYIDSKKFETIEYVKGDIEDPYKFNPPIVIEEALQIFGINEDGASHSFEVLCIGTIYNVNLIKMERKGK